MLRTRLVAFLLLAASLRVLTFTPDGKWIIFSGTFHTNPHNGSKATKHVYAVEIARHETKP